MNQSPLFNKCLGVVLNNEGGYSNHPNDPGGATNFGITHKVYDKYRNEEGLPIQSVKKISLAEVKEIYYNEYWRPMNLDNIEDESLVLHVFDHGVNAGIRTSIKMLQKIVDVESDGYIGHETLSAIESYKGNLLSAFIKRRKLFYVTLVDKKPQLKVFLKGWLNRIDKTKFD